MLLQHLKPRLTRPTLDDWQDFESALDMALSKCTTSSFRAITDFVDDFFDNLLPYFLLLQDLVENSISSLDFEQRLHHVYLANELLAQLDKKGLARVDFIEPVKKLLRLAFLKNRNSADLDKLAQILNHWREIRYFKPNDVDWLEEATFAPPSHQKAPPTNPTKAPPPRETPPKHPERSLKYYELSVGAVNSYIKEERPGYYSPVKTSILERYYQQDSLNAEVDARVEGEMQQIVDDFYKGLPESYGGKNLFHLELDKEGWERGYLDRKRGRSPREFEKRQRAKREMERRWMGYSPPRQSSPSRSRSRSSSSYASRSNSSAVSYNRSPYQRRHSPPSPVKRRRYSSPSRSRSRSNSSGGGRYEKGNKRR